MVKDRVLDFAHLEESMTLCFAGAVAYGIMMAKFFVSFDSERATASTGGRARTGSLVSKL